MRFRHLAAVLAVLTLGCSVKPPASDGPVTMAVVNARIWTGDARRPWADGIAVRGEGGPRGGRQAITNSGWPSPIEMFHLFRVRTAMGGLRIGRGFEPKWRAGRLFTSWNSSPASGAGTRP